MKYKNLSLSLLIIILLLSPSINLLSQGKLTNKEYQPEMGQEGKDVRWFPTPQELVDKMLEMAKITPSDFLIDLGSGDGRTVITAAKKGVQAIGIEYNPDLVDLSKKNALKEGVSERAKFIKADLFDYDFSKATVLSMFLLPEINLRLRPRILEMKPGTRVISTTFTMQNWQYDDMVRISDKTSNWTMAYLWVVPVKVAGLWKFNDGELRLNQQFQIVSGEMHRAGKIIKINGGRIRGTNITFKAEGTLYTCGVENNKMKGTASSGNGMGIDWMAEKVN